MELLVYKASAGSGKTFTLAVEYIKLLILNPRAYRQILAVTFTNKATAEMKERILSQLYGIWTEDPDSDAYLKRIIEETGKQTDEIRKSAGIALSYMLHDYSRFRVETIDSFFQSVMRTCTCYYNGIKFYTQVLTLFCLLCRCTHCYTSSHEDEQPILFLH